MDTIVYAGTVGIWQWVIIGGAILLLFGGKKIPELMKGIGKGIREFNDAKEKIKTDIEDGIKSKENPAKPVDEGKKE